MRKLSWSFISSEHQNWDNFCNFKCSRLIPGPSNLEHSGIFDFKQFIDDYDVHLWFKVIGLKKLTLPLAQNL